MADQKPVYKKTPMDAFRLYADNKFEGAENSPSVTFNVMNGNFRITVSDGRKTPEGQKWKPWITLRLGIMPWITFLGAIKAVYDPNNKVNKVPIVIMDVERDDEGKPVKTEGPAKPIKQATLWVGKGKGDIFFIAVQMEGNESDIPKFPIRPSRYGNIEVGEGFTEAEASHLVMGGFVDYLAAVSAASSVDTMPHNAGRGVGGVGGGDNGGGQQRKPWQGGGNNNYQKKPWQGNNNGGGYQKKPWQNGNGGNGGGYQKKPWQGGNNNKPYQGNNNNNQQGGGYSNSQQGGGSQQSQQSSPAANVDQLDF